MTGIAKKYAIDWTPVTNLKDYDMDRWCIDVYSFELSDEEAHELVRVHKEILRHENLQEDAVIACLISNNPLLCSIMEKIDMTWQSEGFFFIKMHHSPKDACYDDCSSDNEQSYNNMQWHPYLRCNNSIDAVIRLCKSSRIADDIVESGSRTVFIKLWNTQIKPENEFRVFFANSIPIAAAHLPGAPKCQFPKDQIEKRLQSFHQNLRFTKRQYAIDVALTTNRVYIIDINPLDNETDLYGLTPKHLENELARLDHLLIKQ